jgi:tryptophan halogenase
MDNTAIKSVIIVGSNISAYMTAFAMKRRFSDLIVTVLGPSESPALRIGESTTIMTPNFIESLGISKEYFFSKIRPVHKMVARFDFGTGADWDYSLNTNLTKEFGRYPRAYYVHKTKGYSSSFYNSMVANDSKDIVNSAGTPYVGLKHGFHVNVGELRQFLKNHSEAVSVRSIDGNLQNIVRDEQGTVTRIQTECGRFLSADLFIDCTGFKRSLISKMDSSFISHKDVLSCDAAILCTKPTDKIKPYTMSSKMDHGWMWSVDHRDYVSGHGYVYSSSHSTPDVAARELSAKLGVSDKNFKAVTFESGHLEKAWINNVVAVGTSALFIDPMEATGQHLNIVAIDVLVSLIEKSYRKNNSKIVDVYNKLNTMHACRAKEFIQAHYKFCKGIDTSFWNDMRSLELTGVAREIADWYYYMGPTVTDETLRLVVNDPSDFFGLEGYYSVLLGCEAPTIWENPVTDGELELWRGQLQQEQQVVDSLPSYSSK